jgi:hypothetical protein
MKSMKVEKKMLKRVGIILFFEVVILVTRELYDFEFYRITLKVSMLVARVTESYLKRANSTTSPLVSDNYYPIK